MSRRLWRSALAVWIASVMAVAGSVPRDAAAALASASKPARGAGVAQESPAGLRTGTEVKARHATLDSARVPTRVIILLIAILIILWLIYRSFTGWKPMIS